MPGKISRKVSPRRKGPYKIMKKVTPLAYQLDLPESARIYPVVSIQYLTPYTCKDNPFDRVQPPPGPLEYHSDSSANDSKDVYEVERIVNYKLKKGRVKRYLIR
jgi:hypothetical protein